MVYIYNERFLINLIGNTLTLSLNKKNKSLFST